MVMATEESDKMEVLDSENKFQCSICLNSFSKPKIIECFHTFCESCLKDYLNNYQGRSDFPCPLCRKRVKIPSNGVKGFMTNFYLEEKKVKVQEPEPKKHLCIHHNRDLDLYCTECCVTICCKCFRVDHSGHSVSEIEQIKTMAKSELEEVNLKAKMNLQTLQRYLDHMKSEVLELTISSRKQWDGIDEHVKEICDIVKKQGREFKREAKKVYVDEKEKLDSCCKEVSFMLAQSHRLFEDSSDLLQRSNSHEILHHLPYLKVKCLESENRTHFPLCSVTYPKFIPNQTEMSVEQFGELTTNSKSAEFALFGPKQSCKRTSKWRKPENKLRMMPTRFGLKTAFKKRPLTVISSLSSSSGLELDQTVVSTPSSSFGLELDQTVVSTPSSSSGLELDQTVVSTPSSSFGLELDQTVIGFGKSSFELGHIDKKLEKVNFDNSESLIGHKSESLSKTCEMNCDSEIIKSKSEDSDCAASKQGSVSKTGIFGQFSNQEKDENSNNCKLFGDSFTFEFGREMTESESPRQYDFRFFLNSILEKGSRCRKHHFKSDEYLWVVTIDHENSSKLSLQVDLDTLGLYRVSFSIQLINLEHNNNSIVHHEKRYLIHGVWGPGFKWKNFVNLDLLADPNNHFLDVDQQFLIRLTVEDDIYRLK